MEGRTRGSVRVPDARKIQVVFEHGIRNPSATMADDNDNNDDNDDDDNNDEKLFSFKNLRGICTSNLVVG